MGDSVKLKGLHFQPSQTRLGTASQSTAAEFTMSNSVRIVLAVLVILNLVGMTIAAYVFLRRK